MKTIFGKIDYSNPIPPDKYCCGECGAKGVKLWRDYNTFLEYQSLLCADCSEKEQNKQPKEYGRKIGDQIGWRVPAVPTEEGDTYWGYTSVPENGCDWWYNLPTK